MAILGVIGAIAIPQIGWLLGDRRLVRAADQMRIEMTQLRIKSMREGRIMLIEASSEEEGKIQKRAYFSVADSTEAFDQLGSQSALASGAQQAQISFDAPDAAETEAEIIELPEGTTVETIAVVGSARALSIQEELLTQGAGLTQPILFYPDGTTSTAAVVLVHPEHGKITVKLRGLTGDVSVGQTEGIE